MPTYRHAAIATLLALLLMIGCGKSSPNQRVTGSVNLDGSPIAEGFISLVPAGKGASAGGPIEDGKYDIAADKGPIPGNYRVQISAMADTGRSDTDPDTGETTPIMKETIPDRFNAKTELTMNVTADGDNQFNFELLSE